MPPAVANVILVPHAAPELPAAEILSAKQMQHLLDMSRATLNRRIAAWISAGHLIRVARGKYRLVDLKALRRAA